MRPLRGLAVVLIGLVILGPTALAATFECWTDGLYNAESDDIALAAQYEVVAIDGVPAPVILYARGAAGRVGLLKDPGIRPAVLGAHLTRAPPLS